MATLLNDSGIIFDEVNHKYYRTTDAVELPGLTSTVLQWLFPLYEGLTDEQLKPAQERGTYIHKCIEMADIVGATPDCPESAEYLRLMNENNHTCIAHEYTVTDHENFASKIDVVSEDANGDVWLADVKTISERYEHKVRAQLSIYAYWFELLNPDLKVKGLVEIWLPKGKQAKWVQLERVPAEDVKRTIDAYLAGEPADDYRPLYEPTIDSLPAEVQAEVRCAMANMADFFRQEKIYKELAEQEKAKIADAFLQYGVKKIDNEYLTITYVAPTTRKSVDTKKLKAQYPAVYTDCEHVSEVKESIKIRLKN